MADPTHPRGRDSAHPRGRNSAHPRGRDSAPLNARQSSVLTCGPSEGFLRDRLQNYDVAFYLAGIPPLVGGAVLCLIPWVERRRHQKEHEVNMKMLDKSNQAVC